MNNVDFELLYEELNAPKLLPMDLLENLKLDNYLEVNFYNENKNIVGVTKCILTNGEIASFKYTFSENKLLLIEQIGNNKSYTLYDRNESIRQLKLKAISEMKLKIS